MSPLLQILILASIVACILALIALLLEGGPVEEVVVVDTVPVTPTVDHYGRVSDSSVRVRSASLAVSPRPRVYATPGPVLPLPMTIYEPPIYIDPGFMGTVAAFDAPVVCDSGFSSYDSSSSSSYDSGSCSYDSSSSSYSSSDW